jgi:DNA modification methylase
VDANQEVELILERIGARITNDMSNTTDIRTAVTRADSLQGRVLQPFYQDELTTIYCGDSLQLLPLLKYDVIVTDPPYRLQAGGRGEKWETRKFTQTMRRRMESIKFISSFEPEMLFKILTEAEWKSGYFFCNKALLAEYLAFCERAKAFCNVLIWKKENVGPMQAQNYLPDIEYIIYASRKGRVWNRTNGHRNYSRVIETPAPRDKTHPAEKPVQVMTRLIANSTTDKSIVIDPYMGTGATLVAAKLLNRRAIGIELKLEYCRIAADRLSQGVMRLENGLHEP